MEHEQQAIDLHQEIPDFEKSQQHQDIAGGPLDHADEKKEIHETNSASSDLEKSLEETPDGDEPNEYEKKALRHIGESMPASAFLVAVIELCERFTYYGSQGLFNNYITTSAENGGREDGLGKDRMTGTGLTVFYQFWCYVTPILGAVVADQYLGKYNTILIFTIIYMVGLLILWTTALPGAVESAGYGGLITAILVIGLGTGGIKSNIAPLIADQYQRRKMAVRTEPSGERVVINPAITIQRIYMIFYWCINVGALSLLATPYMEKYTGFWSAYLLCFCMFIVGLITLVLGRKKYVVKPPQGTVITDAFRVLGTMIRYRNSNAAKNSWQADNGTGRTFTWDDHFVEEVKRSLVACKVFVFYPIYWVVYGQFSNNFVYQALQMNGHGIPNDLMQNFDPIAIIVFIPILDRLVYPLLRKARINFPPINRITLGFWVASLAMVYAAVLQHFIYQAGPCYGQPLNCPAGKIDGTAYGNNIHIAIQTPAYMLIGISEIFASVTGLEFAYTKAPVNMKSFVQAMYLLTNAFGAAISEAFVPLAYDPAIMWMFAGLAVGSFICGCLIWILFHHYNDEEDEMNRLG